MTLQIEHLRAETPGVQHCLHFNNAGAALMPQPVLNAIYQHLQLEAEIGGYDAKDVAHDEIEQFYDVTAKLLNCQAHNIAYTTSATDAYNRALSAIVFEKGDVILTTNNDYASNQIAFLELQKRFGVQLIRAEDTPEGGVDVDSVSNLIQQHRPKLVAVTHVPTNSGLIQPVAEIGQLCKAENIWYLVDACQSAGQMPLNVQTIQCDFLSATFRKFLRGPRGAGFLYVSDKALAAGLEPLFVDLLSANWTSDNHYQSRPDARRFELWERPQALMLGSSAAVKYALNLDMLAIEKQVQHLADVCREKLRALPHVQDLDQGKARSGIAIFAVQGWQPEILRTKLREAQINTSIAAPTATQTHFAEAHAAWALRVSPHYYNTEEEVETLEETLRSLLKV
jgi:selenocysteine lyase/cysteine desulfurase